MDFLNKTTSTIISVNEENIQNNHASWHSNKIYMVGQVSKKGTTNQGCFGQGDFFFVSSNVAGLTGTDCDGSDCIEC